jgi:aspartate carbamoyltransferase catalytic subunit
MTKGETIFDTAKTYLAMGADLMVIRHKHAGVPQAIAAEMDAMGTKVGILNAGDRQHEHPSQALLDLLTMCSKIDQINLRLSLLKDKKIAIVGDILHSRVARSSNSWSLTASGDQVHLAAPPTLLSAEFADYCQHPRVGIDKSQLFIHWQIEPDLSSYLPESTLQHLCHHPLENRP